MSGAYIYSTCSDTGVFRIDSAWQHRSRGAGSWGIFPLHQVGSTHVSNVSGFTRALISDLVKAFCHVTEFIYVNCHVPLTSLNYYLTPIIAQLLYMMYHKIWRNSQIQSPWLFKHSENQQETEYMMLFFLLISLFMVWLSRVPLLPEFSSTTILYPSLSHFH